MRAYTGVTDRQSVSQAKEKHRQTWVVLCPWGVVESKDVAKHADFASKQLPFAFLPRMHPVMCLSTLLSAARLNARCRCPVVAGMISLINSERMAAGDAEGRNVRALAGCGRKKDKRLCWC